MSETSVEDFVNALADMFGDLGNRLDEAWHLDHHKADKDYENCKICRWEIDYERSVP